MLRGFFSNLIFAIIPRMLCGNHLNVCKIVEKYMMLFLGYEKKIGDILLIEKKEETSET